MLVGNSGALELILLLCRLFQSTQIIQLNSIDQLNIHSIQFIQSDTARESEDCNVPCYQFCQAFNCFCRIPSGIAKFSIIFHRFLFGRSCSIRCISTSLVFTSSGSVHQMENRQSAHTVSLKLSLSLLLPTKMKRYVLCNYQTLFDVIFPL